MWPLATGAQQSSKLATRITNHIVATCSQCWSPRFLASNSTLVTGWLDLLIAATVSKPSSITGPTSAGVLIGADGIHSTVCRLLFGEAKPQWQVTWFGVRTVRAMNLLRRRRLLFFPRTMGAIGVAVALVAPTASGAAEIKVLTSRAMPRANRARRRVPTH